jgi:hypothetical protein
MYFDESDIIFDFENFPRHGVLCLDALLPVKLLSHKNSLLRVRICVQDLSK